MNVTIIGTGYVGLVSGTCFADFGHKVTCIDIDQRKIDILKSGGIPIYEPGLDDLIKRNVKDSRLFFSSSLSSIKDSKIVFLAVGTPSLPNGEANLQYLLQATESIAPLISENTIVVIKSTVPIGTWIKIKEMIQNGTNKPFAIVNNPEFLKEGSAIDDFTRPDRVVFGYESYQEWVVPLMEELYEPMLRQGNPILKMSNTSAELTKYASNCFLATKISFINQMAQLCDQVGADIDEVRKGMISDKRIGPHFLYPGPGYGGSCFPKDVQALIHLGEEINLPMTIIKAVDEVNNSQKLYLLRLLVKHFQGDLDGKKIAFWGVAFKPNTDDVRESPAQKLAEELLKLGASVHFYDPVASGNFLQSMPVMVSGTNRLFSYDTKMDAIKGADALVILTDWALFKTLDLDQVAASMSNKVIFDGRNLLSKNKVIKAGFVYYGVGRKLELK